MKTSYQKSSYYYDDIMTNVYLKDPSSFFRFFNFVKTKFCTTKINDVLDIGCGTGIDTIYFAQMSDFHMTGLDISDDMLNIARKKTNNLNLKIDYLCTSATSFYSPKRFDCIYSYGAFSHIIETIEIEKTLSNIYSLLNSGGILILHQENILGIAKNVHNRECIFSSSGYDYSVKLKYSIDLISCILAEEEIVTILKEKAIVDSFSEHHIFRNWTYNEGILFLRNAGFQNIHCFSSINDREELIGKDIGLIYCCIK